MLNEAEGALSDEACSELLFLSFFFEGRIIPSCSYSKKKQSLLLFQRLKLSLVGNLLAIKLQQEVCVKGRGNQTPQNSFEHLLSIQIWCNSRAKQWGFRVTQMSLLTIEKLLAPKAAGRCFPFPVPWE